MNEAIKDILLKVVHMHGEDGELLPSLITEQQITEFSELLLHECLAICDGVAEDADVMTKSNFVTANGRLLHEGAWGGAKNSAAGIRYRFGLPPSGASASDSEA